MPRIANLPAHWLFVPPLAFAALNNIALKSEASAPLWKSATEEVSSVVVIFALVPLLIGLARAWPPTLTPAVLLRHLGGSVLFSVAHVVAMVAIRHLVFIAAGDAYRPAPLPEMLVCEYGKDLAVYALIVATIGWFDRMFPPVAALKRDEKPPLAPKGRRGFGGGGACRVSTKFDYAQRIRARASPSTASSPPHPTLSPRVAGGEGF